MQSQQIKRFAVVILSLVAIMLSWTVFWPTNLSLPGQLIFPAFKAPDTLFMFFLCNFIIVALIWIPCLGFFTNSNSVTADDSYYEEYGELAYCQQHVEFCEETAEQETGNSEYGQPTEQMKFICSAQDAAANARYYSPNKSKKMVCRDIVKYTENCSVSLPELLQLVEVPAVIDIKRCNELASMRDEDFNRTVEEFITKFNRQLGLQRQQSMSRRGFRL